MQIGGTDALHLAAVLGAGLAAGFINTVAGGGSLLTLPALIFLGLPAPVANATNRVGIILQNVTATATFRRQGVRVGRLGVYLVLAAAPGAALGAFLAIDIDETLFRRLLGVIMVLVLIEILRKGRKKTRARADASPDPSGNPIALYGFYFLAGIYAGFIQAGIGFIIMAILTTFGRLDLIHTNAVKVFTILFLQVLSLLIFSAAGTVDWGWGLTLAIGMMLGGWAGVRWQVKSGEVWVRRFLVLCIVAFSVKLLLG